MPRNPTHAQFYALARQHMVRARKYRQKGEAARDAVVHAVVMARHAVRTGRMWQYVLAADVPADESPEVFVAREKRVGRYHPRRV